MWFLVWIVRKMGALADKGAGGLVYCAFVGSTAFALTMSMTVPFGGILAVAVLLAPRRWRAIAAWSSLGSSLGALMLYLGFHHLGWSQFIQAYPDIAQSRAWRDATRWVSQYGTYAVFVFAALPVPQTPALIFAGIERLPVAEIWLAVLLGKLIKYSVYAGIVAFFPARFSRRYALLLRDVRRRNAQAPDGSAPGG
jgi:membrane protein YqaA with SNARE-associated domain